MGNLKSHCLFKWLSFSSERRLRASGYLFLYPWHVGVHLPCCEFGRYLLSGVTMHVLSFTCMYVFTQLWSKCKKHCHMTVLTVRPKTVEERQHREKQKARGTVGGYNITHTRLEKSSIVHFFLWRTDFRFTFHVCKESSCISNRSRPSFFCLQFLQNNLCLECTLLAEKVSVFSWILHIRSTLISANLELSKGLRYQSVLKRLMRKSAEEDWVLEWSAVHYGSIRGCHGSTKVDGKS